jgi:hypothetical protein
MKRWMSGLLVRLYPRSWRRRYGAEFAELLCQQRLTLEGIVDVAHGAYDAHRTALHRCETRREARREETTMARRRMGMSCSFCGKNQDQAQRLIAGPNGVYICNECVALCNEILAEASPSASAPAGAPSQGEVHRSRASWWRRLARGWQASTRHSEMLGPVAGVVS